MKKLILSNLGYKLPANQNFLQYVSEEMHNNIIALCASMFTDTTKAYVLSGCKRTISDTLISITSGVVYYQKELFFVPSFTALTSNPSLPGTPSGIILVAATSFINETYGDNVPRNAYEVKTMSWTTDLQFPSFSYEDLIRVDVEISEVNYPGKVFTALEGKVVKNFFTQTLILHLKANAPAGSSGSPLIIESDFSKDGLLGYGIIENRTKWVSRPVTVSCTDGAITIWAYTTDLPINKLCGLVDFEAGDDLRIYVNLTHERVTA